MPYDRSDVEAAKAAIRAAIPEVSFFQTQGGLGLHAHRGDRSCLVFQPQREGVQSEVVAEPEDVIRLLRQDSDEQ